MAEGRERKTEFVEGWYLGHTLGEGAYGEVKLVINKSTGEAVAMKMINLKKHPDARQNIHKETTVHRMLSNPHIIRYFGQRSEPTMEYIFLEYASGGELFDRIEPDVGMPMREAQKYFRQLITAVEYLHCRGVAHRDLKPENLLLDEMDNLKITDFGLATVYRLQGKERCLEKRCGTLPYVAPEVLVRPYHAEPADIWSCGIILVALLAGELPWDEADANCPEYKAWREARHLELTPWKKIDSTSLSLIRKILNHSPSLRIKIPDIKLHRWYLNDLDKETTASNIDGAERKLKIKRYSDEDCNNRVCLSQPEFPSVNSSVHINLDERPGFSFSQPAALEDLLLSTQPVQNTQNSTQNSFQKLVRRMTRFFVKTDCDETVTRLIDIIKKQNYTYRINETGIVTISTVDRRKMPLVFKAIIVEMDNQILLDFRLSKGDGLEFKRRFVIIKEALEDVIVRGPVTWPLAVATQSMP
ncbi:serine/threonine-protein kinase grp [Microplitis demolitor]|uniref:serine/threonine-protein kinase grp n=1 Tax=Microplitis demolitor TaxID=69319 RepID=UPI000440001E|nr:serine/threonine-protein kinase grp [Microplitis demolitor]XP_014298801.1 serine/threonine-protein kinase grp [Microplitis demolitor]XP_014298802.1 serine/threonine-protein kinase grp [Microplitis demolitor]XP_053595839.1 serine/threonine-protein kinase grp [Microplitis demolitor]